MYAKGDPFFIQCVGEKKMGQRNRRGCDKTYFDMHATTTQSKELANVKPDGQKQRYLHPRRGAQRGNLKGNSAASMQ